MPLPILNEADRKTPLRGRLKIHHIDPMRALSEIICFWAIGPVTVIEGVESECAGQGQEMVTG